MNTPNAMPKKSSVIGQQIVSALLATKPASWVHKTLVKDADGKEAVVKHTVAGQELKFPLAQNVTDLNVERAARRLLA